MVKLDMDPEFGFWLSSWQDLRQGLCNMRYTETQYLILTPT